MSQQTHGMTHNPLAGLTTMAMGLTGQSYTSLSRTTFVCCIFSRFKTSVSRACSSSCDRAVLLMILTANFSSPSFRLSVACFTVAKLQCGRGIRFVSDERCKASSWVQPTCPVREFCQICKTAEGVEVGRLRSRRTSLVHLWQVLTFSHSSLLRNLRFFNMASTYATEF